MSCSRIVMPAWWTVKFGGSRSTFGVMTSLILMKYLLSLAYRDGRAPSLGVGGGARSVMRNNGTAARRLRYEPTAFGLCPRNPQSIRIVLTSCEARQPFH